MELNLVCEKCFPFHIIYNHIRLMILYLYKIEFARPTVVLAVVFTAHFSETEVCNNDDDAGSNFPSASTENALLMIHLVYQ